MASSTRRGALFILALVAFALSFAYVRMWLGNGPRIIDAAYYLLEAKSLARGHFAFAIPEPSASFRGRFLLYDEAGGRLAVLFPPGWPMILAIGVRLGVPMMVGPVLAAALVWATAKLARELGDDATVSLLAAAISVACATLRYHTADTMSHGASALFLVLALASALRARRTSSNTDAVFAGLATGALLLTRPVSSVAPAVIVLLLLAPRWLHVARFIAAAVPFAVVLAVSQHAATGDAFRSAQLAYYAVSDGPAGCFRWGLGKGIGCLVEHGDAVEARGGPGIPYDFAAALAVTRARLHMHLIDVANWQPLVLPLVVAIVAAVRRPSAPLRACVAVVVLHVAMYFPFYYDGSYPGGGARLYADVLPVEHALLAWSIAAVAGRRRTPIAGALYVAAMIGGFLFYSIDSHRALAARDGGRPMYEPDRVPAERGLVFVDTDHAFAIGHDPGSELVVARYRSDSRDRLLWENLGRPPTFLYRVGANVAPFVPPPTDRFRLEGEAEWPPLAQQGGFAAPVYALMCAHGEHALVLTPTTPAATARIALPVPAAGWYRVVPRIVVGARFPVASPPPPARTTARIRIGGQSWEVSPQMLGTTDIPACFDLEPANMELHARETVTIEASGTTIGLDDVTLSSVEQGE